MLKLGNYNTDYINSVYVTEGYSDFINCNAASLVTTEGQNIVTSPYGKVYFLDNKLEFSGIKLAESLRFLVFQLQSSFKVT